jgi:hypothetical protein
LYYGGIIPGFQAQQENASKLLTALEKKSIFFMPVNI